MEKIKQFMARAPRRVRDRGASLVEYALIVALISVVCIAAVTKLGGNTSSTTQDGADALGGGSGCSHVEAEYPGAHQGTGTVHHDVMESPDHCWAMIPGIGHRAIGWYEG